MVAPKMCKAIRSKPVKVSTKKYKVKKILDKKVYNGTEIFYKVHWEGYCRLTEFTWEPIEHFTSMINIDEYESRIIQRNESRRMRTFIGRDPDLMGMGRKITKVEGSFVVGGVKYFIATLFNGDTKYIRKIPEHLKPSIADNLRLSIVEDQKPSMADSLTPPIPDDLNL
uniref:Chromo domain-containing protein n=1 Tax=Rhabditophanes sp. KR3021 TaxID=114890 RepID=A0AC35TPP8_9BILA